MVGGRETELTALSSQRYAVSVTMEQWTLQHRVFAYDSFVKTGESVTATQRLFRRHFNIERHGAVPNQKTILRWVDNLRRTGSLMKIKPPGSARTVRTPENVERVRAALLQSPRRSARRHSFALRMGRESVRKILKFQLQFHPFKIMFVQKLNEADYEKREDFAVQMLQLIEENNDVVIFMSDEAHFHLSGEVNKQNCRYWAETNPRQLHERPLHSPRVTVWCAISRRCVIGPYFFEDGGRTVTVNSDRYTEMIRNFFLRELRRRRRRLNTNDIWFQQDGATAHTARISMDLLRRTFPSRLISRYGDVPWPPRSPDLSMCDFFLWGYLKSRVYAAKPRTLEELKDAIRREIQLIDQQTLERAWENFKGRVEECIDEEGKHLSDIIFQT